MKPQTLLILALLAPLSGCIVAPRFEMVQQINFDHPAPALPAQLPPEDVMCMV